MTASETAVAIAESRPRQAASDAQSPADAVSPGTNSNPDRQPAGR